MIDWEEQAEARIVFLMQKCVALETRLEAVEARLEADDDWERQQNESNA